MQWNINCLRIALMLVAAATVHGQVPRPSTQQTRPRTGAVPATRGYSQPPAWAAVSKPGLAWDYVLQGTDDWSPATWKPSITTMSKQEAKVYFIDGDDTSAEMVQYLRKTGRWPICYFSVGTLENWRTDVPKTLPARVIGKQLGDWPDEKYWDVRSPEVRAILAKRIQQCADKGFVGIDPDNVDVITNSPKETGFNMKRSDAVELIRWLSREAHKRGLGMGLKNLKEILPEVIKDIDYAVNEECFSDGGPCDEYKLMKAAGKAVYQVEYLLPKTEDCSWCIWSYDAWKKAVCGKAQSTYGVNSILKKVDLKQQPYHSCM